MENANEYGYKFDPDYTNYAILCAKNAASHFETFDLKLKRLKLNERNIKCALYNINVDETMEWVNYVRSIESEIKKSRNRAMEAMILDGTFETNIPDWIKEEKIAAEDFLDFAEYYMKNLYANNPNYIENLLRVTSISRLFNTKGIPKEFLEELNVALPTKIINQNEMYTREGIVTEAYTLCGIFAIFGCTLGYKLGESFDRYDQGLYFGTKDSNLGMLDCCNLNDWLFRGIGLDVYEGGADTMYKYGIDIDEYGNKTPESEYYATAKDEYFRNAQPGDIMLNGGHTRMILEKTETGYVTVEEGGVCLQIHHYTFEELTKTYGDLKEYKICNMDALYRNTSATKPGISLNFVNPQFEDSLKEDQEIRGTGVFFNPDEWIKHVNLDDETKAKMYRQYNLRNKNPYVGIQEIPESDVVDAITLENIEFDDELFKQTDEGNIA